MSVNKLLMKKAALGAAEGGEPDLPEREFKADDFLVPVDGIASKSSKAAAWSGSRSSGSDQAHAKKILQSFAAAAADVLKEKKPEEPVSPQSEPLTVTITVEVLAVLFALGGLIAIFSFGVRPARGAVEAEADVEAAQTSSRPTASADSRTQ